jgi:hypothetical protein
LKRKDEVARFIDYLTVTIKSVTCFFSAIKDHERQIKSIKGGFIVSTSDALPFLQRVFDLNVKAL